MSETGTLKPRDSKIWKRDPLDWYVEPEWCSRRLFSMIDFTGGLIWDPACGMGRIVNSATQSGYQARGTDLVDRAGLRNFEKMDFLEGAPLQGRYSIVTNPPYSKAEEFLKRAVAVATIKVAFLLGAKWILGDKRSRMLQTMPLARVLFLTPRPSMPPGSVILAGEAPGNGFDDFAWYVFDSHHFGPPQIGWCRRDP